ncbi:MAG: hypothetical protein RJA52_419 [Bacteroidota bacterium]
MKNRIIFEYALKSNIIFDLMSKTTEERKRDHIDLAFKSKVEQNDPRFYFEPVLSGHPNPEEWPPFSFLGKTFRLPLWVSSMTGGTALAKTINHNLARACKDFGMGMGLGSCRSLLFSKTPPQDFDVRKIIGDDAPLFANLGIAQVEQLVEEKKWAAINDLIDLLQADGLIVHINPFQEWLQPEGDRYFQSPLVTLIQLLDHIKYPVIVKEVGQGMGPESLKALFELPLAAIDFAAGGGTNFALLELLRSDENKKEVFAPLASVGHSAQEMVDIINPWFSEGNKHKEFIISGGISHFLDGYYLIEKCNFPAIYGQASAFLKHATGDYEKLSQYVELQAKGLAIAKSFLKIKNV